MAKETPKIGHNSPMLTVALEEDLVQMMKEHCDVNIKMGLMALPNMSREGAEEMVELIEKFRRLRKRLEEVKW